jgi:DNA (cytosine-5)-methyltransferase 1
MRISRRSSSARNAGTDGHRPTVISLFAGCGGSSLGYKWAGFKELLAIDFDKNAVETFRLNFPDVPIWQRDIKTVTAKEIMEFCKIKRGGLDILDGSPPCQGFSTAGKRKVNDNRNDLFREFARLIDGLKPKVFVMENVSGMAKGKMKGRFIEIVNILKSLNYNVKCKLMNAMWYGVPQSRERLIWVGVKNNLRKNLAFPKPNKKIIPVSLCPVVDDKPEVLKGIEFERFKHIPPGGNWQNLPQSLINGKARYSNFHRKLHPLKVSFTIGSEEHYSSGRFYHWGEPRKLSDKEILWISSFPVKFKTRGTSKEIHRQIGNSVPPKFMQAIAECIRKTILEKTSG